MNLNFRVCLRLGTKLLLRENCKNSWKCLKTNLLRDVVTNCLLKKGLKSKRMRCGMMKTSSNLKYRKNWKKQKRVNKTREVRKEEEESKWGQVNNLMQLACTFSRLLVCPIPLLAEQVRSRANGLLLMPHRKLLFPLWMEFVMKLRKISIHSLELILGKQSQFSWNWIRLVLMKTSFTLPWSRFHRLFALQTGNGNLCLSLLTSTRSSLRTLTSNPSVQVTWTLPSSMSSMWRRLCWKKEM